MPFKAGDEITQWGEYRVRHFQQHRKDATKTFKPGVSKTMPGSSPFRFPRCEGCPPGHPLYTLKAIILTKR